MSMIVRWASGGRGVSYRDTLSVDFFVLTHVLRKSFTSDAAYICEHEKYKVGLSLLIVDLILHHFCHYKNVFIYSLIL